MRILVPDTGALEPRIGSDPRITQSQHANMLRAAQADPAAEVIGFDSRMRPVVRAHLGGSRDPATYALFRNGAPTTVKEPLVEEWDV